MTLLSDQAEDIRALVDSADPGAVWAVGGPDGVHASSPRQDGNAACDVGGLAPVLALWPVVGSLVEEGALRLHTPLAAYGDAAAADASRAATAHQLLTRADGTAALTRLAEHLGDATLAELATTRVWGPLGMTGTRFADGTLLAPLADLVRFQSHLLSPADTAGSAALTRTWVTESLRIRTGELTPARGLLWHPAPHGVWCHHAAQGGGPALWVSPRHHRWALLLPAAGPACLGTASLRTAFREALFAPISAP
ncbi:hypothetical protein ACF059_14765 [Streptomyces sp. NPDC016562]|uniref:hypothetical protein n=1 Tax=Streptomyces sp. NPDC016562 TaxID=3364966 RepID=UPI0036FB629A